MSRVLEQEVMTDSESIQGYTQMTVNPPNLVHNFLIPALTTDQSILKIADIGCGPCGYHTDLYEVFPNAVIDGYEASSAMLDEAVNHINPQKTNLVQAFLPEYVLPEAAYDLVLSSMFLHQLPDASVNWNAIKRLGKAGSKFVVYDLLRVEDDATCLDIVDGFTPNAPAAFKQDFVNTLKASFTLEEIAEQLVQAGLTATVTTQEAYPSCKVVIITGIL
jgi:ubiquinone/menaquinone biosynthesis C-methylase UbiE